MRYLIGYGYLALVFAVMTATKAVFSLSTEVTRKIVHILIGFTWVNLYFFFILPDSVAPFEVLVLPVSFIVINYLSYRYKILTLIEREGDKNHPGTVYYAVAMTVLLGLTIPFPTLVLPSGIAVASLSFGDGFAAIFGTLFGGYGPRISKDKSLIGSAACAIGSVTGVFLLSLIVPLPLPFYAFPVIGIVTAICELAPFGLDNFAISFGVAAVATLFTEGIL